jgi:hypothetical protein
MTILDKIKSYLPAAETVANIAETIAKVMPVSASIVNAIELGIKLTHGIVNAEPMIEQTWRDLQSASAGGVKVSEDEWAAWLAQVNDAHAAYVAAAMKVEAQP